MTSKLKKDNNESISIITKKNHINDIKERIKKGDLLINYNNDELKYIKTPLGKAIYEDALKENELNEQKNINKETNNKQYKANKKKMAEKIKCDICGIMFTRNNRSKHNITKVHMMAKTYQDRFKQFMLGD